MPRFSIVLPTVDRPDILRSTLAATLSLQRSDLEVVVSNNFCDDRTTDVLAGFTDPRLRVLRTTERIAMPDHWEWIWPQLSGDYVIFTGDDSTVTKDALVAADRAIDQYQAEIISWRCINYYHPDWSVRFRHLPSRGNIIGIDPGFTHHLYRVDPIKVIEHFTGNLRLSGGFPSVVNFLVKKSLGDAIIDKAGRFHWAPCPDISASLFAMTAVSEGKYLYWDGIGALGGRSGQSNVASLLSRGKASKRLREWLDEFSDASQRFPLHDIHLESITNLLGAAISQAKHHYPDRYPDMEIDNRILVERSIDDAYSDLTVPWADDPTFIDQLEQLIGQFDDKTQTELRAYLEKNRTFMHEQLADPEYHINPTPATHTGGVFSTLKALKDNKDGRARRLFSVAWCDPTDRYWSCAGTNFVDMALLGGRTIEDAAKVVPTLEKEFGGGEPTFATAYTGNGMLSEKLDKVGPVGH